MLIVGSGDLASFVAKRILDHPEYGFEPVGFLAREGNKVGSQLHLKVFSNDYKTSGALALNDEGYIRDITPSAEVPIVGTYDQLGEIVAKGTIDQVIIALPLSDNEDLPHVVDSVRDTTVDVRVVPDFHRFIQLGSMVEDFDGLPVMSIASTPLSGFNLILKRCVDFILAVSFLLISSPLFVLIATLVKLSSKGPVFFSQERVGLDGKSFKIFKFRTMRTDAEEGGARFAVRNDPRVTPLGRFLRKSNLDEIPQLINVIKGEMALVGPRPERPVFIEKFRSYIPKYMLRHKVQAGMTGWAQVNGWRGNTSIEKRIQHDLFYIENWSLLFDLKILIMTFFSLFRDKNAY